MRKLSPAELVTLAATPPVIERLGAAETAVALADLLAHGDVLVALPDEPEASAVARALAIAAPEATVLFCPGSDALPGEDAPASPANVGQRVAALRLLRLALNDPAHAPIALVTTGEALARRYPRADRFEAAPPVVEVGAPIDLEAVYAELLSIGYIADERVDEPGEVALRGQVLDVFPADAPWPLRIEIADGDIASIRRYDPADQRTIEDVTRQEIGRASEPALADSEPQDGPVTLLDHIPDAQVVLSGAADDRRKRLLLLGEDAARRGSRRTPRDLVDAATWKKAIGSRRLREIARQGKVPPRFVETSAPLRRFARLVTAAHEAGERVVVLGGERDLRFLRPRIAKATRIDPVGIAAWGEVAIAPADAVLLLALPADRGFRREGVLAIAAADLIGSRAESDGTGETRAIDANLMIGGEIRIGDVVIHEDHGIGVIAGLEALPDDSSTIAGDAIRLTYAGDATRLVPVNEADRLWRYGAEADAVTLDKLDGSSWDKRRADISRAIAETARSLTALAEERAKLTAPVFEPDPAAYERFAAGFPFSETADQAIAIHAVRADLASGRPMDRIVVGDVGFGKTEVALRAAALVALAGGQVAIAAPTTVLARQHFESFTRRFEGTGVEVAGLSRLSSAAEKKRVKAGLADGSIGIVVGTGAVAGKGVTYHNLGLVVVDEEQRFGTADKNRLHDLSGGKDMGGHMLTLSATPIPRTLQAALVGIRQLSLIATPPARRQPIRTTLAEFSPEMLRAALLRERSRGGQSFVVVPRIEDMAPLEQQLRDLVPELELLTAHGKMAAADIDEAMVRFGRGDGDVLLATNIIEAGLDVPRANTMAIMRADRFGLSQLHQLRGRVGRGSRRGQVLLFTAQEAAIAPRTLKRLRTLEAFDRLGAGFEISARDLDMRGAGDLIGDTQAGHMKLIGVALYQELLEGALREARGETVERWMPELNLGVNGRFSEDWLPDEDLRVSLYARLAQITDAARLDAFEQEIEDRFGALPEDVTRLLAVARVRLAARQAAIARIDAGPGGIALTPHPRAFEGSPPEGLTEKNGRFVLSERIADPVARLDRVQELLGEIAAV